MLEMLERRPESARGGRSARAGARGGGEALPESMRELMAKLMAEDILSPEEHAELVNAFITTVR